MSRAPRLTSGPSLRYHRRRVMSSDESAEFTTRFRLTRADTRAALWFAARESVGLFDRGGAAHRDMRDLAGARQRWPHRRDRFSHPHSAEDPLSAQSDRGRAPTRLRAGSWCSRSITKDWGSIRATRTPSSAGRPCGGSCAALPSGCSTRATRRHSSFPPPPSRSRRAPWSRGGPARQAPG